jgi:hypothetical protein
VRKENLRYEKKIKQEQRYSKEGGHKHRDVVNM